MFSKIKEMWLRYVIRTLFERIPGVKKLWETVDGKKVYIGRVGVTISLILFFLQSEFPSMPYIDLVNTYYAMIAAWVFQELGIQHRTDKELREALLLSEFGDLNVPVVPTVKSLKRLEVEVGETVGETVEEAEEIQAEEEKKKE